MWAQEEDQPFFPAVKIKENPRRKTINVQFMNDKKTTAEVRSDVVFAFCPKEELAKILKKKGMKGTIVNKSNRHYKAAVLICDSKV